MCVCREGYIITYSYGVLSTVFGRLAERPTAGSQLTGASAGMYLCITLVSFFNQSVSGSIYPINCGSNRGVHFMDLQKASNVRWRCV